MKPLQVGLIGIGGWGKLHVGMIAELAREGLIHCAAYCEPYADRFGEQAQTLNSLGAAHYTDYQDMLKHPGLDFAVVATPIPLHKRMCIDALQLGVPVLLEKPPAVTIEDLDEMIEVQSRTGVPAAVQFQNTSGKAFRQLLSELREGRIGKIMNVTAVGMWKRSEKYYSRTYWAGAIRYRGEYVLDGTLLNPFSHLLHNAFVAAGAGDPAAAEPVTVQAELYKGHRIESEDTAAVRIRAKNGVSLHIYTTLCHDKSEIPYIDIEGESGRMRWYYNHRLHYASSAGQEEELVFEDEKLVRNMYLNMIRHLRGEEESLFCPLQNSRSMLLAANGAFTSSGIIRAVPEEQVKQLPEDDTTFAVIDGIDKIIAEASIGRKLFSEIGVPWAVHTPEIEMVRYRKLQLAL
ncbi:Gfo/Idh/MocA family oxidoreductase [Paenibacillus filicis]|uniref:Gfo/Idh/MocA family oxidoreductase n=1 Tax=Paenibacillus gyeongsangnamensis TaxID=3388067 RepID=A0ABT4QGE2_9BACL|nr:Gfo/Idh/MocA family oxidoreductase [Paenibacillus filicis]MCZ8515924.1 Gfo/Idh/MocA family oxidoreductase [Paenibacillus filicis]